MPANQEALQAIPAAEPLDPSGPGPGGAGAVAPDSPEVLQAVPRDAWVLLGASRQQRRVIPSSLDPALAYLPVRVLVAEKVGVSIVLAKQLRAPCGPAGDYVPAPHLPPVAIKIIQLSRWHLLSHAHAELSALRAASGPARGPGSRVVALLEDMMDREHLYLVMPFYEGGDLFDRTAEAGVAPADARRHFADVAHALLELKHVGMAHGDVSLENVMLSASGPAAPPSAFLIDLGSSCVVAEGNTTLPGDGFVFRGKAGYVAPEMVGRDKAAPVHPYAADTWALGVLLYVLLTGRPLYLGVEDSAFAILSQGRAEELIDHYASFGLVIDPLARDLVCAMLDVDPLARPSLEEVLAHPWLA